MRRLSFPVLVLILMCAVLCSAQTQQAPARRTMFQFGVGMSYFHPNVDELNTAYAAAEQAFGLARWSDFAVNYLAEAFVRVKLTPEHLVSVRGAASFLMRSRSDDSKSYYTIFRLGPGYDYVVEAGPVKVLIGASVGWMRANFQRTYRGGNAGISTAKNTWYLDGGVTGQLPLILNVALEANVRYMFSPSVAFGLADAKPKLRSPAFGISLIFER